MRAMAAAMMKAGLVNEQTMAEMKERDKAAQKERNFTTAIAREFNAATEALPGNIKWEVKLWIRNNNSNNSHPIPLEVLEMWSELKASDAIREWSRWLFASRVVRFGA